MAEYDGENKVDGVFGGVNFGEETAQNVAPETDNTIFTKVETQDLPVKPSIWTKVRSFLFQEIDLFAPITVELTPYQQKIEDEINEFLHQEITFKGFFNLFKKNKEK